MSDATPPRTTGATLSRMDSLAESLSIASQPDTMTSFRYWHSHNHAEQQRWRDMAEIGVFQWLQEHGLSIVPDTLLDAVEAVVDDHHDAGEFAGVPLGKMQDLRDRWDAYKQERS